jgi:hypothetical protein
MHSKRLSWSCATTEINGEDKENPAQGQRKFFQAIGTMQHEYF